MAEQHSALRICRVPELGAAGQPTASDAPSVAGIIFGIRVPPVPEGVDVENPPRSMAPADLTSGLRILVVEDNAANLKLIDVFLSRMGYHHDVARNGVEAVAAAQGGAYDLILMDVQMPEMDGIEATRRIRAASPAGTRPRIVALTAGALPDEKRLCTEAGVDEILNKPIVRAELAAALQRGTPSVAPPSVVAGLALDGLALRYMRESMGDAAAVEVIEALLGSVPVHVEALDTTIAAADTKALRLHAHSLLSSAMIAGAGEMARLCRELEVAALAGRLEATPALASCVTRQWASARTALIEALEDLRQ